MGYDILGYTYLILSYLIPPTKHSLKVMTDVGSFEKGVMVATYYIIGNQFREIQKS